MKLLVQQFNNIEQASNAVVDHITDIAGSAIAAKGLCTVALTGGKTPQLAYELLSRRMGIPQPDWQKCHFFWGDERWVPSTHADSNYFMAHKTLLSRVKISPQNIHPIHTGYQSPEAGAEIYEKHLRDFFRAESMDGTGNAPEAITFPSFDLIMLGMGADGHVASLFPGSGFLREKTKWVTSVHEGIGSPPVPRISLTMPVINQARNVLFLISGKQKRNILNSFIDKPMQESESKYPAAHVKPTGKLIWVIAEED